MAYDTEALKTQLTREEARKNHVYRDSEGILTVGVGWNLEAGGIPDAVKPLLDLSAGDPMDPAYTWPDAAIDALLHLGIGIAERGLDKLLPAWRQLDDARQLVLMDMCFNMGEHRLGGFRKFLAAVAEGDWDAAAYEMKDSAWYGQVGVRAQRLVAMMGTGEATA